MSVAAAPNRVSLGVALIVATAFTISVQDLIYKLFSNTLTLWQIFSLRGLIAVPALLAITRLQGQFGPVWSAAFQLWPMARALCLTGTFLAFYAAVPFLSLSTLGAAIYIAPVFIAVLSSFVIHEPVGRIGWVGVVLGFVGVIVLLRPGTDAFSPYALLPVLGALFYAVAHIITRWHCQAVPVAALALALSVTMCGAALVISAALVIVPVPPTLAEAHPYLLGPWSATTTADWMFLAGLAVLTIVIGLMMAAAYKMAPPAIIGTFEYSYLIFVLIWDILFFAVTPTVGSLTGMVMIVAAGLLVIRGRP